MNNGRFNSETAGEAAKKGHEMGRSHEFDSNSAKEAGRKGGLKTARNREHMSMIGRKGGKNRWLKES